MKEAIVKFPSQTSYSEYNINGYVLFTQKNVDSSVEVEVKIKGLPNGLHGFHIHEYALQDFQLNQLKIGIVPKNLCKSLGGHFNPFNTIHGSYRYNTVRHVGDLINNLNVINNKVHIIFEDPLISLYQNQINCIIDRSIVIHLEKDDEGLPGLCALNNNDKNVTNNYENLTERQKESLITGNAGKRIACGNIVSI